MPRKIIFLDIDGVLNTIRTAIMEPEGLANSLEPDNIEVLNEIVRETGAAIVISSSWRLDCSLAELREGFAAAGAVIDIIDMTPDLDGAPRGHEVAAWIAAQPEPLSHYVILDDDHDMPDHPGKLVKISAWTGLHDDHVPRVLALLEG